MQIVMIGNSAAALNAAEVFRQYNQKASLTLVSQEEGPAYSRVLLPYFLRGKLPYEKLFFLPEEVYEKWQAKTCFGCRVTGIDTKAQRLHLADSSSLPYDKLLIAAGANPVMPGLENLPGPGVFHLWSLQDALNLAPYFQPGKGILVIGSGFIALQAAWAALSRGMRVTLLKKLKRIMPRVLDATAAGILEGQMLSRGINLIANEGGMSIERLPGGVLRVFIPGQPPLDVDAIIVAVGARPNTDFLQGSGLEIDGGILVNAKMETNLPGIYAAGDITRGLSAFGEPDVNHALWSTAVEGGKIAGANMAGQNRVYTGSLNMNVTEMFGLTVASMGKFQPCEGEREEIYLNAAKTRYAKLVFAGAQLRGGVILGQPEDAALLGLIRPLIRQEKQGDKGLRLEIKRLLEGYR